jgi:hypothetical protein
MRFTYADDAPVSNRSTAAKGRGGPLQRVLTLVLGLMAAFAVWEIVTFAQDYWRALHGG